MGIWYSQNQDGQNRNLVVQCHRGPCIIGPMVLLTSLLALAALGPFGWSPDTVTAWATAGLFAVGAVSIVANIFLVVAGFREASAARAESENSRKLIEEVNRDRELAYRPFLSFESLVPNPLEASADLLASTIDFFPSATPVTLPISIDVANIGRGLAIGCQYAAYFPFVESAGHRPTTATYESDHSALPESSQVRSIHASQIAESALPKIIADLVEGERELSHEALVCLDQFGKKYRFIRGKILPEIWPDDYLADREPSWAAGVGTKSKHCTIGEARGGFLSTLTGGVKNRPYLAVVVRADAPSIRLFTPSERAVIQTWVTEVRPDARAEQSDAQGIAYGVTSQERLGTMDWRLRIDMGLGVTLCVPAPVEDQPDGDALALVQSVAWWMRSTRDVRQLLERLGLDRVHLGYAAWTVTMDSRPIVSIHFSPAPSPPRDAVRATAIEWHDALPISLKLADIQPTLLLPLLPSLFDTYSYRDYEPTLEWFRRHIRDNEAPS